MRSQLHPWHWASLVSILFQYGQLTRAATSSSSSCDWNPLGPLREDRHFASLPHCTILINDKSKSWVPWSVRPVCAHPENGNGGKIPYCVFAKHGFRGTQGISIIATPEIAAELAGLLEDPDPAWLHHQARLYYHKTENGGPAVYSVKDVPGRGKGMVANRDIRAGEVILRENPVIINLTELPPGVEPEQVAFIFNAAFTNLPEPEKKRILAMARSRGDGHVVDDILNTNGIGLKIGQNFLSGLFPEVSVSLCNIRFQGKDRRNTDLSQRE